MAYRIYLVDDDRFLLDLYAVKFKGAGHDVSVFGSSEDLLAALRKEGVARPDAVLIDLIMPGVGGFEALETIRKERLAKGSKIIILSNQGQDSDFEKAKQLAVDGYIVKASAIPSEVFAETIRIIEGDPSPSGNPSEHPSPP
ncbi:response regulator [Candidatus Kaiserbacteria bacterium]|nr:response regulator [Candidatus Kaiserbacteria bacterium]